MSGNRGTKVRNYPELKKRVCMLGEIFKTIKFPSLHVKGA